jgi:diphthamide biosynthesis protein 3
MFSRGVFVSADEIEIEDMEFDDELQTYFYPCPCGDRFRITVDELMDGEEIATCPSCTLVIRVIYELEASSDEEDDLDLESGASLVLAF